MMICAGILLYGASGCGKTLIAQALASDAGMNFISVTSSDIFSKWLGDSERIVRNLFTLALQRAPCIILFDEIDAIATARYHGHGHAGGGGNNDGSNGVEARVLATLLNEMNGIEHKAGIITHILENLIRCFTDCVAVCPA